MFSSLNHSARVLYATLLFSFVALHVRAEARYGVVNVQNDAFVGRDGGGYSNGTFVATMRMPSSASTPLSSPDMLRLIAPWLGVQDASIVAFSAGQTMVTPRNLESSAPNSADVPYAGGLTLRVTQIAKQDHRADLVALSLGVIGPAAGAEQTQKAIHRLIGSEKPMGWDTQVSNRAMVALERSAAWRYAPTERFGQGSSDVILQSGGTLGNLETFASVSFMLRYGEGLAQSFPTMMPVTSKNGDPFSIGEGWFVFGGLSAERVFHLSGFGTSADYRKWRGALMVGLSYGWRESALTFALRSADSSLEVGRQRQTYGSLTYVIRLR